MNIAIGWSEERQTIAPMDTSSYRYFVRVDGNCEENRSRVETVFGKAELTVLDGLDEFAFVTEKMTEAAFKAVSYTHLNDERRTGFEYL